MYNPSNLEQDQSYLSHRPSLSVLTTRPCPSETLLSPVMSCQISRSADLDLSLQKPYLTQGRSVTVL